MDYSVNLLKVPNSVPGLPGHQASLTAGEGLRGGSRTEYSVARAPTRLAAVKFCQQQLVGWCVDLFMVLSKRTIVGTAIATSTVAASPVLLVISLLLPRCGNGCQAVG